MQLPYSLRGAVWILIYLLFILAPLFALLAGSHPPTRNFWTEFSVALGYSGLAMMGLRSVSPRAFDTSPSRGAKTSFTIFTVRFR